MSDVTSMMYCSNCQREIPTSNYEMHVIHCRRNITLCPKCQEPVPHSELDDHDLEFHSEVKCSDCHKTLEKSSLDDHKANECPKRKQTCQYCDLELGADNMLEHIEYCGARTETCETCRKLVMLKHQQMHEESGHRKTRPDEGIMENGLDGDGAEASARVNVGNHYTERYNYREPNLPYDMVNTYPIRRLGFDINDLDESLENLELDHARNTATVRLNAMPRHETRVDNTNWEENTLIPCEFCEVPIIADQLVLHQTGCRPDLLSAPKTPQPREEKYGDPPNEYGLRARSYGPIHPPSPQDDNIMIPCEFCQKPFDLDLFAIHQTACQNRPALRSSNRYGYYADEDD